MKGLSGTANDALADQLSAVHSVDSMRFQENASQVSNSMSMNSMPAGGHGQPKQEPRRPSNGGSRSRTRRHQNQFVQQRLNKSPKHPLNNGVSQKKL